ncbi:MAG: hypothetical protein ABIP75_04365 [Pyrinomonadaceae bacterium]
MIRRNYQRWPHNQKRWPRRLLVALTIILPLGVAAAGVVFVLGQQRARRVEVNGNTIKVAAGGDLQAALDRAQPGDTIYLAAGATFSGPYSLPNKSGSEFITIRSDAADANLPVVNERIDPRKFGPRLPKLISNTYEKPAVRAVNGAHHYRFIAVEFGPTPQGVGNVIELGTSQENRVEDLPHHLEFDRCYIHGSPTDGQRRGIAANGKYVRVINSYFADFKRKGDESQAIAAWGSDGPFDIINNYIEAGAEGILFGGAIPKLPLIPSDITVRGNTFNKPLEWRGVWLVKNHFELKSARRVKIENNLMTNNWADSQNGTAVLFTVRVDSGPWATIEDVEFTGNIVRGSGAGVNVYGGEGMGGRRLAIRNNVFSDINSAKWGGRGQFMTATEWDVLTVENNTIFQDGNITSAYGKPITKFVFRNNIVPWNEIGMTGDSHAGGQDTIDTYFPGGMVVNNAFIGGDASRIKARNAYPASPGQIRFVDLNGGDLRLRPDSPMRRAGASGADIGANLDPATVGKS